MNYIFSNFSIHNNGIVSKNFLNLGVKSFHSAIDWVKYMPYGRNNDRTNYLSIFSEYRGTCSTKHALLNALALENNQNIILKMVICKIDKYSNKSIKSLLEYLKIEYFPEAHCIISNDKDYLDITFPGHLKTPKAE